MKRSSSVDDYQIAGRPEVTIVLPIQDRTNQLCVFVRPVSVTSIERLTLQSKILWRNRECLYARSGRTRSDQRLVCNCHFVKAVAAVNDPCVFDVKKDQRRRDPRSEERRVGTAEGS